MATTYEVNYIIDVQASSAVTAINRFRKALSSIATIPASIEKTRMELQNLNSTLAQLKGAHTIQINLRGSSEATINKRAAALERLNKALITNRGLAGPVSSGTVAASSSGKAAPSSSRTSTPRPTVATAGYKPQNLAYKNIGATMLPNNGGMAIDMLKGMGIAFGIAGIGALATNIVKQSAEFDNIMKTVENILKSHDSEPNFYGRYGNMSKIIRNVGMETKYKATEVADAAKFLAMAGFNVSDISSAIRPIADIALVGDTELGATADLVTNIMKSYKIKGTDMRKAADMMTNTFTMSNTTLTEMAESFKYAGAPLALAGVGFEEATAAIGMLGDAGIKGSLAGTSLRMIMQNIAKPTSNQEKAWERIGISTKDANGKTKDLLTIFRELKDKGNIRIEDLYSLFRVTATPGAAVLMNSVDRWEEVIMENMLSGGLSSKLADAKKNTLQGLWAQMTSVFTDQGIKAFDSVQGTLRKTLGKMIDWMKTEQFADGMRKAVDTLMEFVTVIKDALLWFKKLYDWCGSLLKMWIKFQLTIWPLAKGFAALKTVWFGLLGLKAVSNVLMNFGKSLKSVGAAQAALTASTQGSLFAAHATPFGFAGSAYLPALTTQQYQHAARGLSLSTPMPLAHFERLYGPGNYALAKTEYEKALMQSNAQYAKFNKRVLKAQAIAGVKSMAPLAMGALGAGLMMSTIGDDTRSGAATALYGLGGVASMFGAPGMAIGGGLMVLGGIVDWFTHAARLKEKQEEALQVLKQYTTKDGALYNENATGAEKYLQVIYDKNCSLVDVLNERIRKTKEALGLESTPTATGNAMTNETFNLIWENSEDINKLIQSFNEKARVHGMYVTKNREGGYDVQVGAPNESKTWKFKQLSKDQIKGVMAAATQGAFGNSTAADDEAWSKQVAIAALRNAPNGQERLIQKLHETYGIGDWENGGLLYSDVSLDKKGWERYLKNPGLLGENEIAKLARWNALNFKHGATGGFAYAQKYFQSLEEDDPNLWGAFVQAIRPGVVHANALSLENGWLQKELGWNGKNFVGADGLPLEEEDLLTRLGMAQETKKILNRFWPNGSSNPEVKTQSAILDSAIRNLEGFLAYTQLGAEKGIGLPEGWAFPDGALMPENGKWIQYDANNNIWTAYGDIDLTKLIGGGGFDAYKGEKLWIEKGQQCATDWAKGFANGLDASSFLEGFVGKTGFSWLNSDEEDDGPRPIIGPPAPDWRPTSKPKTKKKKKKAADKTLRWEDLLSTDDLYNEDEDDSRPIVGPPAPDSLTAAVSEKPGKKGRKPRKTAGLSSSEYKSHYASTAAPKQINITIQNLMNVDKIDLSDPNKQAVISDIKREIAYALVEAASDAGLMLNQQI